MFCEERKDFGVEERICIFFHLYLGKKVFCNFKKSSCDRISFISFYFKKSVIQVIMFPEQLSSYHRLLFVSVCNSVIFQEDSPFFNFFLFLMTKHKIQSRFRLNKPQCLKALAD